MAIFGPSFPVIASLLIIISQLTHWISYIFQLSRYLIAKEGIIYSTSFTEEHRRGSPALPLATVHDQLRSQLAPSPTSIASPRSLSKSLIWNGAPSHLPARVNREGWSSISPAHLITGESSLNRRPRYLSQSAIELVGSSAPTSSVRWLGLANPSHRLQ